MAIHPLATTELIRDSYLRYLKTIKPFQDDELRREFAQAIAEQDMLVKGPLVQVALPYEKSLSICGLVDEGVLSPRFARLCSDALPYERLLYTHQVAAIRKVVNGRNLVVSTGTGSGKTEAFLIPILNYLLREQENGTLSQPGVRALLLYPMNALANDQMKRLRQILKRYPAITFGRYIGDTPQEDKEVKRYFAETYPNEPFLPNELKSRDVMHAAPPHLLLTNYAMLEYLLLRPISSPLFDGETGKHWKFVVLDEAHIYDGANATEMAMLLRRVQDRVAGALHGKIKAIATSATLGAGRQDYPAVAEFASKLFNKPFVWDEYDEDKQDVVGPVMRPIHELGVSWGQGSPELYAALHTAVEDGGVTLELIDQLEQIGKQFGVPDSVLRGARTDSASSSELQTHRWLYAVLKGDENIQRLLNILQETPALLHRAARQLFPTAANPEQALIDLVAVAVMARAGTEEMPLLPARYHTFARALEGAFICLNQKGHPNGEQRLFLHRQKFCPTCQSRVFELANCTRCGTAYIIGQLKAGGTLEEQNERFKVRINNNYLTQDSSLYVSEAARQTEYFVVGGEISDEDQDQLVVEQESIKETHSQANLEEYALCPLCGQVQLPGSAACSCGVGLIEVRRVDLGNPQARTLKRCISCSTRSSGGAVFRFLTGQDAPVSVLASALYQQIPPAKEGESRDFPGNGRKLLNFTDSRQNAAFFAPYVERSHMRSLRRRLILKTVEEFTRKNPGVVRLQDLLGPLVNQAEKAGLFGENDSPIERQKRMAIWLMQDYTPLDRRISLEGLGLMRFEPDIEANWQVPAFLTGAPWHLDRKQAYRLLTHLLNTLRWQGAVSYLLPDQNIEVDQAFEPRNRRYFIREQEAEPKRAVFAWMSARGFSNARTDYLKRVLVGRGKGDLEAAEIAEQTLRDVWSYLTGGSPWSRMLPGSNQGTRGYVHHISHEFWRVTASTESYEGWFICNRCHNIYREGIDDVCMTYACPGKLEPLTRHQEEMDENLYRQIYLDGEIVPLVAEEHTAQWTPKAGAKVQSEFIQGKINLLSCSTTFELGVDVGDLQSVLMRNVPPTTANYIQRAGRAGRRTDSAAYVLTYAQRRPHDLTYYADPEKMVAGKMKPPYTPLENEKILRRHLHSVVFAAFFRWAKDRYGIDFRNVGQFFLPEKIGKDGRTLLLEFLEGRPESLKSSLIEIVPKGMVREFAIEDWAWIRELTNEEGMGVLDLAFDEVTEDYKYLDELVRSKLDEFSRNRTNTRLLGQINANQRIINELRDRDLLGFLGNRNVLPKYGFPSDVVELRTNHLGSTPEAQNIELSRDLRMAISEFAPGSQVIAAKKIWTSCGLKTHPRHEWPNVKYVICRGCKRFHHGLEVPTICSCGEPLGQPKEFIEPRLGFIASSDVKQPGESQPERTYANQVYFGDYAMDKIEKFSEPENSEIDEMIHLQNRTRHSRYGWMVLVNDGMGQGFRICPTCGFAEVINFASGRGQGFGRGPRTHQHPVTGRDCSGRTVDKRIGHKYLTDVLEIQLDGTFPLLRNQDAMQSLTFALLEGASEEVGIRRDDIDGMIFYRNFSTPPSLILYDTTPGGAGHVKQIQKRLHQSAEAALLKMKNCQCGLDTSCYNCLRNYRNQRLHDKLQRGHAIDLLKAMLGK